MLQELCYLAEREQLVGDPAFDVRPVAWIIHLKPNGDMIGGFSGTHEAEPVPEPKKGAKAKKPKEVAKKFIIPRQFNPDTGGTRTAGDYAYFLVDKSDYVLGCNLGAKANQPPTDKKLINRHQLFISKVRQCYNVTGEERLKAVLTFLERVHSQGLPVDLPVKAAAGDLFAFIVRPDLDEFVHDFPAVGAYWKNVCSGESGEVVKSKDWHCLITGNPISEPALFPLIKKVPGGQAQTGIVSFNKPAFTSYGWDSNANAPVSADAGQAASVALNRLLDPAFQRQDGQVLQRRNIRINEDTVACYWPRESKGDELADGLAAGLQADPGGKAGEFWRAAWRGKAPPELDPSKFYAVTLTGAQGRAIVRDWYETTVGEVQESVAVYFSQLELRPNTFPGKGKELPPQYGLRILEESLTSTHRSDDVPSKYAVGLFAASINKKLKFPSSLLSVALERMRAEAGNNEWIDSYRRDARTALIKAILIRNHEQTIKIDMDYENKEPGYLLGCLFACIERMQYLALGDQINANIANRYFAAASTTPQFVMSSLIKDLNTHYTKKAQRRKPGLAINLGKEISAIMKQYDGVTQPGEGFPARMSLKQQGLFMIGYHVQRGEHLKKKEKPENSPDSTNSEDAEPEAEA